jgi:hypothetical protein
MAVNYNDPRFNQVEKQEQQAKNEANSTYNEMISGTDGYYQEMIDATKDYANQQQQMQQEQTNFAIEQVNQQKEQAEKDYVKEQKGAYTDYQKASNQYGANAEAIASQGMSNTGFAESSQVSMYNTYQNRYMTARETYNKAVLNYDNSIKEAQLANNSKLAEIAYQALQTQLQLSLEGFQYKNTLLQQKLNTQREIDSEYYGRWQNVLSQINTENALAEQIRQYNASLAEQKRQADIDNAYRREQLAFQKAESARSQANWEKEYNLSVKKANSSSGSSSINKNGNSNNTSINTSNSKVSNTAKTFAHNLKPGLQSLKGKAQYETTKNGIINNINNMYQNGGLTDADVKYIFKQLGLE